MALTKIGARSDPTSPAPEILCLPGTSPNPTLLRDGLLVLIPRWWSLGATWTVNSTVGRGWTLVVVVVVVVPDLVLRWHPVMTRGWWRTTVAIRRQDSTVGVIMVQVVMLVNHSPDATSRTHAPVAAIGWAAVGVTRTQVLYVVHGIPSAHLLTLLLHFVLFNKLVYVDIWKVGMG